MPAHRTRLLPVPFQLCAPGDRRPALNPGHARRSHRRWANHVGTALLACAAALPACDGQISTFDPLATSQAAAEVVTALQRSPAFQTLDVLGEDVVGATTPAMVAATLSAAALPRTSAAWAKERASALTALEPRAPAAPIFPADLLGQTLVYNASLSRYELSSQTGAPANGVRFILYAVDTALRIVKQPLDPIGYLDLIDASTPAAAVLRVMVVIGGETLLDYDAGASFTTGSIGFDAEGFISDGDRTVEFDLSQTLSTGPTITVAYSIGAPAIDVALEIAATITGSGATVTLTVHADGNTTIVSATGNQQSFAGTITHNGTVVINISGSPDDPVFTDANGNELTDAQIAALEELFAFTDAVFDAFDNLLHPAYRLLDFPIGT